MPLDLSQGNVAEFLSAACVAQTPLVLESLRGKCNKNGLGSVSWLRISNVGAGGRSRGVENPLGLKEGLCFKCYCRKMKNTCQPGTLSVA